MDKSAPLYVDFCSAEASRFAVTNWHYSRRMPVNKLVKFGAWELGEFKGTVIFGVGASAVVHHQFNVEREHVCELVRVALREHHSAVSRIVAITLRMLRKENPGLRVCVSFADPSEGHHGGIYQAGGWIYTGMSQDTTEFFYRGQWRHVTDVYKRLDSEKVKELPRRTKSGKHRYVMPFDSEIRKLVVDSSLPYPKRA